MSLSIGIVGLPNVGKSTLFNALTKKSVPAENYPFCTIDPSVGVVAVPDERLGKLSKRISKIVKPELVSYILFAILVVEHLFLAWLGLGHLLRSLGLRLSLHITFHTVRLYSPYGFHVSLRCREEHSACPSHLSALRRQEPGMDSIQTGLH